jgi:hypothetical protein
LKLLDAQIDWRKNGGNDPRLEVLVDEIPDRSDLRFEVEDGIWCGIGNGSVEFFSWSGEGNDSGYLGRCYEIRTVEGESVTLRGPWSSRAGCVNKRSFGPVVNIYLATDPEVLERG